VSHLAKDQIEEVGLKRCLLCWLKWISLSELYAINCRQKLNLELIYLKFIICLVFFSNDVIEE